ncbi:MAG: aldo/keto reductase, partial [Oscillospiraceae bacterium]|nr:aldo/keto reductase [Oscillospiraceae bacterium]
MKTILIGTSGIEATALGLGTWAIGGGQSWGDSDDALSIRTIHQAVDMGITWVDTAPVYGFGHSEEVVGQALKGRRDKVILSTKCGLQWYDKGGTYHLTRDGLDIHRDLTPRAIR